jgi:hypothetical protein
MKSLLLLAALSIATAPVSAAEKRVFRIDGLIATQKKGAILLEAKGAVPTGGWTKPRLHVMHGDGHTLTVEFLATPPPLGMTVIDAVVPMAASVEIKGRATSVHVLADENEMTSQVLR